VTQADSPEGLLARRREAGHQVRRAGDRLGVRPSGLPPDLRAALLEHRAAVLALLDAEAAPPPDGEARPYLTDTGDLVIPFAAPARYRWWAGGQSILATLAELGASEAVLARHRPPPARQAGQPPPPAAVPRDEPSARGAS
jgi:hypothetical protein